LPVTVFPIQLRAHSKENMAEWKEQIGRVVDAFDGEEDNAVFDGEEGNAFDGEEDDVLDGEEGDLFDGEEGDLFDGEEDGDKVEDEKEEAEDDQIIKTARMLVYRECDLEWVPCKLVLRQTTLRCVELRQRHTSKEWVELKLGTTSLDSNMLVVDEGRRIEIDVLPDRVRSSKHSKLCTFSVVAFGEHEREGARELLLAAASEAEMWEWCKTIRRRGRGDVSNMQANSLGSDLMQLIQQHGQSITKRRVQELLLQGATVDWTNSRSLTPMMEACGKVKGVSRQQIVELLLSCGANVHQKSVSGANALVGACFLEHEPGRPQLVRTLLDRGIAVDSTGNAGNMVGYIIKNRTEHRGPHAEDVALAMLFLEMGVTRKNDAVARARVMAATSSATTITAGTAANPFSSPSTATVGTVVQGTTLDLSRCGSKTPNGDDMWSDEGSGMSQVPAELLTVNWLLELDLSLNTIVVLPVGFFGALAKLQKLDLGHNCLVRISPTIGTLTDLKFLDLAANRLTQLPLEMCELESLAELRLGKYQYRDGNPIVDPPPSVWEHRLSTHGDAGGLQVAAETEVDHASRVRAYMSEMRRGGAENWELKLTVLGRSEVGKTSLINAMLEGGSRLVRVGDRTVGVEQREWAVEVPMKGTAKEVTFSSSAKEVVFTREGVAAEKEVSFAGKKPLDFAGLSMRGVRGSLTVQRILQTKLMGIYVRSAWQAKGIKVGDVLTKIDGEDVVERMRAIDGQQASRLVAPVEVAAQKAPRVSSTRGSSHGGGRGSGGRSRGSGGAGHKPITTSGGRGRGTSSSSAGELAVSWDVAWDTPQEVYVFGAPEGAQITTAPETAQLVERFVSELKTPCALTFGEGLGIKFKAMYHQLGGVSLSAQSPPISYFGEAVRNPTSWVVRDVTGQAARLGVAVGTVLQKVNGVPLGGRFTPEDFKAFWDTLRRPVTLTFGDTRLGDTGIEWAAIDSRKVFGVEKDAATLGVQVGDTLTKVDGKPWGSAQGTHNLLLKSRPCTLEFAKTNLLRLRVFDFAGQREYYLTHHLVSGH
jgi:hypothetical protein